MRRTIWIACAAVLALVLVFNARAEAAEICGDRLDNDGNGMTDEGCYPAQQTGVCESPLSCLDTGWVGWATGSLRYDLPPDVAPKSPWGPQIGLRRIYTSQYAPPSTPASFNRTPLGPRWQHNYMSWIDRTPNGDFVIHTAQGEDVLVNGVTWVPQRGHHVHYFQYDEEFGYYTVSNIDGSYLIYNSLGQLIVIGDRFANMVQLTWTTTPNGSVVSTVTDATNARRLSFGYTASLLTSVRLQFWIDGAWTTFHTTTYAYAGGQLASVTMKGQLPQSSQLAQSNVYTNGYLSQINDGEGRRLAAFKFASARPGETDLIDTANGTVGFEFGSTRDSCPASTLLYFNKANETSCSSDADCGGGALCGGKTGPGATGACFRGARCLTVDSHSGQSLVTGVSSIGPASETCTGACAEVTQYVWNVSTLDLGAVKDALGSYTTAEYNANGQPTKIVYADTDADAHNGGGQQTVYLNYSGPLLTEIRRPSAIRNDGSCSQTSGHCAVTHYAYFTGGALASVIQSGYTLSSTGSVVPFGYQTSYTYDERGRVTSIDGPLDGDLDKVEFAYPWSADPTQNGFLSSRLMRGSMPTLGSPLYEEVYRYDFWGNPIEWADVNGQLSCLTYDPARNYPTISSVKMAGFEARCDVDDPADLIERYTRDSALRLTRTTRADGSCVDFEYEGSGRLARTTLRDDCDPARSSPGDRTDYTYDADGLLTQRTTYDAAGTVKHKALATYYDSRRLQGVPNPVDTGKVATLDYDERGVITAINSEQGLGRTQFDLDANYQVRSVARFQTPTTTQPDTWRLDYDALGRRTTVTDPDNKSLVTTYDDLGRPVRQVSPDQTAMNVDRSFNALSRVESETNLMQTQRFTYDPLGRLLAADYGDCPGTARPEAEYVYDAPPTTCPSAQGCFNLKGRLAYSRIKLMCILGGDGAIDQETFYSYDPAGRLIGEYIRDDTPRVADQTYTWTKGGTLAQVTLPSSAAIGWTYGGATSNSDTDLVTAVWKTTPATPIIDNVQWNPFGPLKQYDRQDTISGSALRMTIDRNLTYRPTSIHLDGQIFGGPYYRLLLTEDAKGRVKSRDYYPSHPQITGMFDSYFLYDGEDRLLCEATAPLTTTCPTSGATIKNNHLDAFTGAGDRKTLLRPVAGSGGGFSNVFALAPGTHRIDSVAQDDGLTPLGTTTYTYDALGRRTSEDNPGPRTSHDRRTYEYDARGNLVFVHGTTPVGGAWHDYIMTSAFDARNRRVFKEVLDYVSGKRQRWFFYYDAYDRLSEVHYIPDASVQTTFTTYQLIWLDDLLVAYWQTDSPSGTTSKRYTSFDETGRPVRMHSFGASGNSVVTWAINPDAWGMDNAVIGPGAYQPIGFAGQYIDSETASYLDDSTTRNRPGLVLNGFRTYDPFTGSYLQLDPLVEQTWNAYGYADGNPVGNVDPMGLEVMEVKGEVIVIRDPWNHLTESLYSAPLPGGGGSGGGGTGGASGKRRSRGKQPKQPKSPPKPPPQPEPLPPQRWHPNPDQTTCSEDLAWLSSRDRDRDIHGDALASGRAMVKRNFAGVGPNGMGAAMNRACADAKGLRRRWAPYVRDAVDILLGN